jgi:hypothetical protein
MAFQPGNKLAVGRGRPKGSGKSQIAKEWAETKGLAKLQEIAEWPDEGVQVHPDSGRVIPKGWSRELQFEALKLMLAYGLGKPTERHELSNADGEPLVVEIVKYGKG